MRIAIRAARDQNAQSRILVAAQRLAGLIGMNLQEDLLRRLQVQKGDVSTRAMLEREAIADLLERMADVAEVQKALDEQPPEPPAPPEPEKAPEPAPVVIAEAPTPGPTKKPRGRKAK